MNRISFFFDPQAPDEWIVIIVRTSVRKTRRGLMGHKIHKTWTCYTYDFGHSVQENQLKNTCWI